MVIFKSMFLCNLTDENYKEIYDSMTENRKNKVKAILSPERKKQTLMGEYIVKELLSECTKISKEEIEIDNDSQGKPVTNINGFNISISHSKKKVWAAVSDKLVGIDTEKIRNTDLKLAKRICNEKEGDYILNSEEKEKRFFEIWTFKEACFKYGINFKESDFFSDKVNKKIIYEDDYITTVVWEND